MGAAAVLNTVSVVSEVTWRGSLSNASVLFFPVYSVLLKYTLSVFGGVHIMKPLIMSILTAAVRC
jgi:hypothetical protein